MTNYAPESTYFKEKEAQLVEALSRAKTEMADVEAKFAQMSAGLVAKRDHVLGLTQKLAASRSELGQMAHEARVMSSDLSNLAHQCQALDEELLTFLKPHLDVAREADQEIASIREQLDRKVKRPKHEIDKLEARLSRLRFKKEVAERAAGTVPDRLPMTTLPSGEQVTVLLEDPHKGTLVIVGELDPIFYDQVDVVLKAVGDLDYAACATALCRAGFFAKALPPAPSTERESDACDTSPMSDVVGGISPLANSETA